ERASDPDGIFGGSILLVRDERTTSLLPWSLVLLAASVLVFLASVKAGPQRRGAMLLLAAGLVVAGAALAFW
ncbi:MAG: hypothetical protein ACO38W_10310, partial [Phycisphaerales bacterium]